MDADGGSRAHFMVTRSVAKKDEQDKVEESGVSTPELPKKIQKVSVRPDFSHGCEILVAEGMSSVDSLPSNAPDVVSTKSDSVGVIGDSSSNVPENDCVSAPESTPPLFGPDPSSDLCTASFPTETPLDATGDLKDGDTSCPARSLPSTDNNEPETVPTGGTKQTNDTVDQSNEEQTNGSEGNAEDKTRDSASESASKVSAREPSCSEGGETTSIDDSLRTAEPDTDSGGIREESESQCNVFGGESSAETGGDLERSVNQGCTKLSDVGPNGRESTASPSQTSNVPSLVIEFHPSVSQPDNLRKTDENTKVSTSGCDVLAQQHPFLSCWKKSFETTAYKDSEVWRGHRWGLVSVETNASNGLEFNFGPKTPQVGVHHFGTKDSTDHQSATNPSLPFDGAAKPVADSQNAAKTTLAKGFNFSQSADTAGATPKTSECPGLESIKSENSPGSLQKTDSRTLSSFAFPFGPWSCQTSNFGVAQSGSFFSIPFRSPFERSNGTDRATPASDNNEPGSSSHDAPPASFPSAPREGRGLLNPANTSVDTISPQSEESLCSDSTLQASNANNAINVFRFSRPDARPPKPPASSGETAPSVPSIWPTSSEPSTSRDVSAGGDATGFNFSLVSPMEPPKCSKYQSKRWKPKRRAGAPPVSAMEASMLRSLECPVCLEPCTPPIFTCFKGHHVCSTCRPRIKVCAVCKAPMSTARNWLAEDISLKIVKIQCKNAQLGCTKRLYTKDMLRHVRVCPWSVCCTVLESRVPCLWRGTIGDLDPHVRSTHHVFEPGPQSTQRPVLPGTSDNVLMNVRGSLYQCHLDYSQLVGGWYPYCRYLGQPDATPDVSCEFELFARGAHFRLCYVDRVLHFADELRKDLLLVVNGKLVENLLQGGHEVFYTVKMICD